MEASSPAPAAAPLRVLVVEDDVDMAQLLRFMLEREGFGVTHVPDGRQALAWIEKDEPPALVLLDVMLPYLDGIQILGRIRARPGWQSVPVVVLTAAGAERDVEQALRAGASDHISKPFKPREVVARLRRFLKPAG